MKIELTSEELKSLIIPSNKENKIIERIYCSVGESREEFIKKYDDSNEMPEVRERAFGAYQYCSILLNFIEALRGNKNGNNNQEI